MSSLVWGFTCILNLLVTQIVSLAQFLQWLQSLTLQIRIWIIREHASLQMSETGHSFLKLIDESFGILAGITSLSGLISETLKLWSLSGLDRLTWNIRNMHLVSWPSLMDVLSCFEVELVLVHLKRRNMADLEHYSNLVCVDLPLGQRRASLNFVEHAWLQWAWPLCSSCAWPAVCAQPPSFYLKLAFGSFQLPRITTLLFKFKFDFA